MWNTLRDWFGWGGYRHRNDHGHDHPRSVRDPGGGHSHVHGVVDPSIATTERGIWAIKWSFAILAFTAAVQVAVVFASGSVALLADTIHNLGDAATAIPLWVAFRLARWKPTATFTYGFGRAEDLAGITIVLIILLSAIVAGYEAIDRLLHPQAIQQLAWVAVAGLVGFLGNEAVAAFRIRVGRQINSTALIADGYHARTDGLTSLAVVLGAAAVWFGFPLADPIVGLLITIAIVGIVWQSARAVLTRLLDGVEPGVVDELRHAGEHVPGINEVIDARARWVGHQLHAELTIAVNASLTVAAAHAILDSVRRELFAHVPALAVAHVRFGMTAEDSASPPAPVHGHRRH